MQKRQPTKKKEDEEEEESKSKYTITAIKTAFINYDLHATFYSKIGWVFPLELRNKKNNQEEKKHIPEPTRNKEINKHVSWASMQNHTQTNNTNFYKTMGEIVAYEANKQ